MLNTETKRGCRAITTKNINGEREKSRKEVDTPYNKPL
jgi:hypothetical protein